MNCADYAVIFKSLSDETRLKIIKMLNDGEKCACKILENLEITQPTLSYHMKLLCDSEIVTGKRDGTWMRYSLNKSKINIVVEFLSSLNKE